MTNAGSDVMGGADPGAVGFTMGGFEPRCRWPGQRRGEPDLGTSSSWHLRPPVRRPNGPFRFHQPLCRAGQPGPRPARCSGTTVCCRSGSARVTRRGRRGQTPTPRCIWSSYYPTRVADRPDAIKARADGRRQRLRDTGPSPKLAIVAVGASLHTPPRGEGAAVPAGRPTRDHPELRTRGSRWCGADPAPAHRHSDWNTLADATW
jgi:hypothetical protein